MNNLSVRTIVSLALQKGDKVEVNTKLHKKNCTYIASQIDIVQSGTLPIINLGDFLSFP